MNKKTTIDALRALETLHGAKPKQNRDRETEISDLIADLLHLASESGLQPLQVLNSAWSNFKHEQAITDPESMAPLWLCYSSSDYEAETVLLCDQCAGDKEGVTEAEFSKYLEADGPIDLSDFRCEHCGCKPAKAGCKFSLLDLVAKN